MDGERSLVLPPTSLAAGAKLYWKRWPAAGRARAVALIAHGYAEHLGRYQHVAAALNAAGYDVFALDHWGHGKSDGARGFVPAFSVFVDGLEALLSKVKSMAPELPRVLIGHSMGGLISAGFMIDRQSEFVAAVLSGAALTPVTPPSSALVAISKLLSKLTPKLGVVALDAKLVSRDAQVVAAYVGDPLVFKGKMGARLGAEMMSAMADVGARASSITLPILILHGEKDGLTSPEGSRQLHLKAASRDKTLTIYPSLFHEIFNEPERDRVIADMIGWLNARLPASGAVQ
jgi:alpha-beta hydrolase superfamily lysophospholipase